MGTQLSQRFHQIINLVFTQFYRDLEGNDTVLPAKNIDTGMGFERMLAVLQGVDNVYDTDAFSSIIAHVELFWEEMEFDQILIGQYVSSPNMPDHLVF
ncbi:MAG: hypothetical protein Ct9H300mP19_05590 [Dehalococcoidia bacterium]|nr:MAG: hypothetical protein Ct9H300mP19_05590 [Dehalococcoidia bacterium]